MRQFQKAMSTGSGGRTSPLSPGASRSADAASKTASSTRATTLAGWLAVLIALAIGSFWAYWGTIENFHEGWYYHSLGQNLALMFGQYLLWPILFCALASLGVWRPKVGGAAFVVAGLTIDAVLFKFKNPVGNELFLAPCVALGALFFFGRVGQPRLAIGLVVGVPVGLMLCLGAPLGWRVSHRLALGFSGPVMWQAGGETLEWAPPGPGWPTRGGMSPAAAAQICDRLDSTGYHLENHHVGIWRLPTAKEAVAALNRGGSPAGCRYVGPGVFPPCDTLPDKEAPLWDPYSMIIYWWTSSEDERGEDLRVAYNGFVLATNGRADDTGFRAVRDVR